jgi:NitT/TauT family transport system substrate-binding protein
MQTLAVPFSMLPEPAATALISKSMLSSQSNAAVRAALDLSEEWTEVSKDSVLTMGCIVVRTEFAKEHRDVVNAFLTEYAASINYVNSNVKEAAKLVAQYGITASEAVAVEAIPRCNLVCITGSEVRDDIQGYYEVLFAANPASIGGSIPYDAFYYIP